MRIGIVRIADSGSRGMPDFCRIAGDAGCETPGVSRFHRSGTGRDARRAGSAARDTDRTRH